MPEAQANMDKLKGMSGEAFDKAFKAMMIEDHNMDIAKYEKQASSGDAKTAALAKDTLPIASSISSWPRRFRRIARGTLTR